MLVACLKAQIEGLPDEQFIQAWRCIEEINAALSKAGPVALLAMEFTRAQHGERVAQLLESQQAQIGKLNDERRTLLAATAQVAKLERKVAKLKKKSK